MNEKKKKPKPYYTVSSFARGLYIIELLAEKGALTVSELGRLINQNRTVAYRFLSTLHDLGYVSRDNHLRYRLTLKLFEIGNRVDQVTEIRDIARPYMRRLAEQYDETVNLGRFETGAVVTIDVVLGNAALKFESPIGSRSPAHTLAMGKAILAHTQPEVIENYIQQAGLKAFTPNTITQKDQLRQELNRVRRKGYAIDDEEWAVGLRCVAAPIFSQAAEHLYAISISGPTMRMTAKKMAAIRKDLMAACQAISQKIGHHSPA